VLKPGGRALVQVPIWRRLTYEDWTKTSPDQRRRAFYQADHVRLYGLDIVDHFAEPGFAGEIHRAQDFGPSDLTTYGLSFASTDEVFVFQKPEESPPRPPVDPEA
jgi:hypothetical protein